MSEMLIDELVVRLGLDTSALQSEARQTTQLLDKLRQSAEQMGTGTRQASTQAATALTRMRGEAVSLLAVLSGGRGLNRLLAELNTASSQTPSRRTAPRLSSASPLPASSATSGSAAPVSSGSRALRQNQTTPAAPFLRSPFRALPVIPRTSAPALLSATTFHTAPHSIQQTAPFSIPSAAVVSQQNPALSSQPVSLSAARQPRSVDIGHPLLPVAGQSSDQKRRLSHNFPQHQSEADSSKTGKAFPADRISQERPVRTYPEQLTPRSGSLPRTLFLPVAERPVARSGMAILRTHPLSLSQHAEKKAFSNQSADPKKSAHSQLANSLSYASPAFSVQSEGTAFSSPVRIMTQAVRHTARKSDGSHAFLHQPAEQTGERTPLATKAFSSKYGRSKEQFPRSDKPQNLSGPAAGQSLPFGLLPEKMPTARTQRHTAPTDALRTETSTLSRALASLQDYAGRVHATQPYLPGSPLLNAAASRSVASGISATRPITTTHIGPVTITVPSGNPHAIVQALQGLGGGDSHTLTSLATIGTV
ncbi:hypothetical protein KBX73_03760 [Acetobacter persici]|uniref:hypothetical protein n=1 Tax=Acetobacter persici TaxID=1076596 RepID=UPI0020CDF677|nr:hypothetical protein [Acetobacter persici]MCP9318907.1 hypothetical protein [Acetobacter persici]